MNEHLGVVNRLQWMQRTYDVSDNDCILQKTPFSFDVSVWEFFLPLMTGARLLLAEPEGHKDPNYMMSLIREHDVTISHFVPSMLSLFLEHVSAPLPLKKVFSSGEALPVNTLDKFKSALPGVALHNLYGPTEAAIDVSHWDCLLETSLDTVPIGLPVDNTQLYILDASMNACPIGVTGELFIGGVQVARGYHNQPELTKERFLPDIFHPSSGSKLYKTGDLARFRHDGNIEYVGRNDFQVKIRGFRIELEEIENTLRGCPGVKDCVVLAQPIAEDNLRLVAFLIAQGDEPAIDDVGVQDYMREQVSEFMIPSAYQWLDAFPLNPNGKLDRKQLMQLAEDTHIELVEGDSVDGPVEMALEQIWQSLLNCGQLGRSTHFYAVGGQSLLAVKLLNMINQQFGLSLSLSQLINNMTIAEQASLILAQDSAQTIATQANDTSEPSAEVLALPTQKAIYKSVKLAPNNLENNSYLVLAFDSSNPPEHKSLKKALQKVFSQYLSLHARYSLRDDKVILTPAERFNFRLEKRQSLGTLKADLVDFVRPFTLEDGCNVRARLIYGDDIHLLLDFSHASVDGMAISLILQQLSDVELLSGEPLCRLSDYSRLYYSDNMATIRQQHHDYWVSRLIDQKRNKVVRKGTQAITLSVMVNRAETAQLAQIASSCLVSVSEICMTIFLVLKARIEGQHEQLSSVAFHGRDTLMQQGVVAPIMSVLPILVDVPYKLVKRVLNDVCDVMRDAFKHYLYDPQNIAETNADISNTLLFPNSFYGFYEYPSYQADIAGSHCVQIEAPDVIEQSQLWNNTCEVVYRGDELMVSLHFTGIDDCLDAAAVERMYREILKETFDLV